MFDRLYYTWDLMGASWQVLKQDKTLLLFPLLSGICCLLVTASFGVPLFMTGYWSPPAHDAALPHQIAYYTMLFAFYFANYFVITFFNAGIISCAISRLQGGDASFADGMKEAVSRLALILGWALLSATVGLILRIIEDRSEKIGSIVAGLLGMAFSVVSFLVVPILVLDRKDPFAALKESTRMLKKTWGEQLLSGFSFGLVFFVLFIPGLLFAAIGATLIGVYAHTTTIVILGVVLIAAAILYFIILSLVQSTMQAIFQAAVYMYARDDGQAPQAFGNALLASAMRAR